MEPETCTICGHPIRWVHVSSKATGRWTHVRPLTGPGPRPWHHAEGPPE